MRNKPEQFFVDNAAEPVFGLQVGPAIIDVHRRGECSGEHCVIHNPSRHHMRDWPLNWRADRRMMERICPDHQVGHPDPDALAHKRRIGDDDAGLHGCCGCCEPPLVGVS